MAHKVIKQGFGHRLSFHGRCEILDRFP